MKKLFLMALLVISVSCTENQLTREFGGETNIKLPKGKKLIDATWKDNNLWYLYEDMDSNYIPKTKVFQEASDYGVLNGKVIFIESK